MFKTRFWPITARPIRPMSAVGDGILGLDWLLWFWIGGRDRWRGWLVWELLFVDQGFKEKGKRNLLIVVRMDFSVVAA